MAIFGTMILYHLKNVFIVFTITCLFHGAPFLYAAYNNSVNLNRIEIYIF